MTDDASARCSHDVVLSGGAQAAGDGAAVLGVIAGRRSPAVFDPAYEVSDDDLRAVFEAARWAPSCGNSQPWRYLVGRRGDATFEGIAETLTRGNRRWAPAASVLALSLYQVETVPGARKEFVFERTAQHDVGQATAFLTLAAHSVGLAVHQFAGFDVAAAEERFSVPPQWRVMTGIAMGRAWPSGERDASAPAVRALSERFAEYDLEGNAEREKKPRNRKPMPDVVMGEGAARLA